MAVDEYIGMDGDCNGDLKLTHLGYPLLSNTTRLAILVGTMPAAFFPFNRSLSPDI